MRSRLARWWAGQARHGVRVLSATMVVLGVATIGVGTASGAAPARQDAQDPLALFSAMMPVFSSPRCVNCHGGVDPTSDEQHEGGKVDVVLDANGDMHHCCDQLQKDNTCTECHTDASSHWRTAPKGFNFVNKDALTLCRQIRSTNQLGTGGEDAAASFIRHLSGDELIGLAFEGRGAIGETSAFAPITPAPPPMSREDFVGAAQTWLNAGHALCGLGWSGTINVTKTSQSQTLTQGNTVARDAAMKLTETIDVAEGEATGTVHLEQHDFTDSGPKNHDCTAQHLTWAVDGTGAADVQVYTDVPDGQPGQIFFSAPAAKGTVHLERIKNGPTGPTTCIATQMEDPYTLMADFLGAKGPIDPSDLNHFEGTQTELSPDKTITTTIKWKLSRGGG
jgi:hypothetical protein